MPGPFGHHPPSGCPRGDWQSRSTWFEGAPETLIGDLIREGVTGVAGSVSDPYLQERRTSVDPLPGVCERV